MNQDEITQIYETLAPMAGDYANAQAEQIGQAQRSMGPMAANVMGQSQTAGLGNYTYNRLMRPQVDVMRDEIRVQGYTNQLNKLLSDSLNTAKNNYNKRSSGSSSGTVSSQPTAQTGEVPVETQIIEDDKNEVLYLTPSEAYNLTKGTFDHALSKYEIEQVSGRPMTESNYNAYLEMWEKYKNR